MNAKTDKRNAETDGTRDKLNARAEKTTATMSDVVKKTTGTTAEIQGEGDGKKGRKRKKTTGTTAEKQGEGDGKKGRERKKNEIIIPDDGVPYDRGWAWMIVLAGFVNLVIASGYNRGTFIFFVNFLEEFGAPVTETALIFGVKMAVNSVVGLFIMNAVVGRFGVRKTVLVGGICLFLSAIFGSLARDVTSLVLSQAVFHGLGMSMLGMPTTVLLGFYFRRRRSLANSLVKCGVGVGAVAFPPIVTYLLERYGLRGSLLLMGGVCLNIIAAASLLRPVSFYQKQKPARSGECSEKLLPPGSDDLGEESPQTEKERNAEFRLTNGVRAEHTCMDIVELDERNSHQKTAACSDSTKGLGVVGDRLQNGCHGGHVIFIQEEVTPVSYRQNTDKERRLLPQQSYEVTLLSKSTPELHDRNTTARLRLRTVSLDETVNVSEKPSDSSMDIALDALNRSKLVQYMSMPDLEYDSSLTVQRDDVQAAEINDGDYKESKRTCRAGTWRLLKRIFGVLDFSLFHSPMFRLMVFFFICAPMLGAVTTYLPAMSKERGLDENQSAILLSIIGALDFCSRLIYGYVADLKILKVSTMIAIAFTIMGVVCQLIPFLTTYPLLIGLAVAQGMLSGVAACLTPILIMEDIGLENTAKALGFNKLFSGAAMAAFHPLLGYIRDRTGSYDVAYHVVGAFTLVSAASMFCLRFVPHRLPTDEEDITLHVEESSPLNHNANERKEKRRRS